MDVYPRYPTLCCPA